MCQSCQTGSVPSNYVELHLHTVFSAPPPDSLNFPDKVLKRACELGYSALGVSEHRNLNSAVQMALAAKAAAVCNHCGKGSHGFDWDGFKKGKKTGQQCQHCGQVIDKPTKFKIIHALEVDECDNHVVTSQEQLKTMGGSHHFWLGAMSDEGWLNLVAIQNESVRNGSFGNKNRISLDWIEANKRGRSLAATSACIGGRLASYLIGDADFDTGVLKSQPDYEKGKEFALRCATIFEEFYLELQANEHKDQILYNTELLRLHQDTGIPLIITKDVHYLSPDDGDAHDTFICTRGGSKPKAHPDRKGYPGGFIYYLSSKEEVWEFCQRYGIPAEAMENTVKLAQRCTFDLQLSRNLMPTIPTPAGYTPESYVRKRAFDGLIEYLRKYRDLDMRVYIERLEYELSVLNPKGFASYFLMLMDIVDYAHSQGIPTGPGRGSVCASLVAMCLGITRTDPILGDLIFERFLNPERASFPDIDTDVSHDRRHQVAEYIMNKYVHCMHIPNWQTLGVKGGIKAVGRAFEIPLDEVDILSKLVPEKMPDQSGVTLEKVLTIPDDPEGKYRTAFGKKYERIKNQCTAFRDAILQKPNILDALRRLEGAINTSGLHAAGIVVLPDSPDKCGVPLTKASDGAVMPVCGWDMNDVEKAGLLKLDLLGLRTVTVMHRCWQRAGYPQGLLDSPINERNMTDPKVYRSLANGETEEVFQVNGDAITQYLMRVLKAPPWNIEAIVAVLALFRPGPLDAIDKESGLTLADLFVRNREESSKITYMHPDLEAILNKTFGVMVYQEDVMAVFRKIAGYSWGGADSARRIIGKKKIDEVKALRGEFVERSVANGYTAELAGDLYDMIEKFAGYAFNKAHAKGYAVNTYETAYQKVYHPAEFMAAAMSSVDGKIDDLIPLVTETKRLGISVLGPSANESEQAFLDVPLMTGGKGIRFGLLGISGVGTTACDRIIAGAPYASLVDFIEKLKGAGATLNKNGVGALIKSGAFDWHNDNRYAVWNEYHFILRKGDFKPMPADEYFALEKDNRKKFEPQFDEATWDLDAKLTWEKEILGMYITGHPLQELPFIRWQDAPRDTQFEIGGIVTRKKIHTARTGDMAWLTIETVEDSREVTVFPKVYTDTNPDVFTDGAVIRVKGTRDRKDPDKMIADKVTLIRKRNRGDKGSAKKGKATKKKEAKAAAPATPELLSFDLVGFNEPATVEAPTPSAPGAMPVRPDPLAALFNPK